MSGGIKLGATKGSPGGGGPAFSLVELLVVISIIALLAALVLPALASSKMQARRTGCLGNVKQMTAAGLMYMIDTSDGLPSNIPGASRYDPNAPMLWWNALAHYAVTSNLLLCPSTLSPPSLPPDRAAAGTANLPWVDWDASGRQSVASSFGFNGYLEKFITPYPVPAAKLPCFFSGPASVQQPARTPFFFDEISIDTFPLETDAAAADLYMGQPSCFPAGAGRGMACCTILRHGGPAAAGSVKRTAGQALPGAINMSFDDGHTELAKLQNLWNYSWHLNWKTP